MRRLLFVLFQLDEAKRYIQDGRIEQMRLALVLLDNAVELQMERRIRFDIEHERMTEASRRGWEALPREKVPEDIAQWLDEWTPLSRNERRRISRSFDVKVDYLTERWGHIDKALTRPLKYLHRYRNDAYHEARIREDTIRTAALILLELNCQLLLSLPIDAISWSDGDDYSWLKERYGLTPHDVDLDGPTITHIVEDLRSDAIPDEGSVVGFLADNLRGRYDQVLELIGFIAEMTGWGDMEQTLAKVQFEPSKVHDSWESFNREFADFVPPVSASRLDELKEEIGKLTESADLLDAFSRFSEVEEVFEPLEMAVIAQVHEIDEWVNLEIDRRLGK